MIDHFYAVIMAGGGGTRLWPLSRKVKPKQLLENRYGQEFVSDGGRPVGRSLHRRIGSYIVTVAEQAALLQAQCPQIPKENFLIEPMPRGTASVVGLAAVALQQRDPQAVMADFDCRSFYQNITGFQKLLQGRVPGCR